MNKLWCYQRQPIDSVYYDPRLALSMHLALETEDGKFIPLLHNSGVLFAKATENANGSLNPKSIKNPWIFILDDKTYGILAVRTLADGEDDEESKGSILFFTTSNFVDYKEVSLLPLCNDYVEDVRCENAENATFSLYYTTKDGAYLSSVSSFFDFTINSTTEVSSLPSISVPKTDMETAILRHSIEISDEVCDYLKKKLLTPYHTETHFPEKVLAGCKEDLDSVKARLSYSDGTVVPRKVDWDLSTVDFSTPGNYKVNGKLHQDHFPFPVAESHADPCIGKWNGKYYFIATYDGDHEHTMYIREADSIPELVNAKENLILDSTTYEGIGGLLWAPELHIIGGRLCILHAATPDPFFEEESRIMILKDGGNPIVKEDWEAPRRIVRPDGTDICEAGKEITLDMTHFVWEGEDYVIWSQRQFLPVDLGAWLYIGKLNRREPWKLASEPVLLTKPEYGWENNHTFVVEGPFALLRGDTLHITYSAAAVDTSYVVGLLSIQKGADLLNPADWKKKNYPILTSRSVEGEFGTGHNAYCQDDDGIVWNTYHARPGVDGNRCSGIRSVHFDVDDEPMLDVTEELDVTEAISRVSTIVEVKPTYQNPPIFSDIPDPDIIRSKDTKGRDCFYMVSTTMHLSPGAPILKSYDLISWTTVNYVYDRLEDSDEFSLKNGKSEYSGGSWAASLREDEETGWYFVAFTCNFTQKTYIFMTDDIENGPWYRTTFPEMCYDNGVFFDKTDGRKYIFFSENTLDELQTHDIYYRELFVDTSAHTIEYGEKQFVLHNSNFETPKRGLWGEGYHVYQHNGYYYLFAIQGYNFPGGWQRQEICWRSESLTATGRWDETDKDGNPGGWTCKKVFTGFLFDQNDNILVNHDGIAQGGIIDTPDGDWYCFIFQDSGAIGRVPMLCKMEWGTEGDMKDWPIVGEYLGTADELLHHKMPNVCEKPIFSTDVVNFIEDDDFDNAPENFRCFDLLDRKENQTGTGEHDYNGSNLNLQWQWNHNPDNRRWSLTERPGFLRLRPVGAVENIRSARNNLTVRTVGETCKGTTCLDFAGMMNGMTAGLCVYQRQYAYIGIQMENDKKYLVMYKADHKEDANGRCCSKIDLTDLLPAGQTTIYLRITCDFRGFKDEALCHYSVDNKTFIQLGELLNMCYDIPDFMGYRYGLFTYSTVETDGYADFDWFHF